MIWDAIVVIMTSYVMIICSFRPDQCFCFCTACITHVSINVTKPSFVRSRIEYGCLLFCRGQRRLYDKMYGHGLNSLVEQLYQSPEWWSRAIVMLGLPYCQLSRLWPHHQECSGIIDRSLKLMGAIFMMMKPSVMATGHDKLPGSHAGCFGIINRHVGV